MSASLSDADRRCPGRARALGPRVAIAYALLLGECVVILIPSVYARIAPRLFGIPFFYWFQLMWILVAMIVTGVAYALVGGADRAPAAVAPAPGRPAGGASGEE